MQVRRDALRALRVGLDRRAEFRDDAALMASYREAPAARVMVLAGDVPVLRHGERGHTATFTFEELEGIGAPRDAARHGVLTLGSDVAADLGE